MLRRVQPLEFNALWLPYWNSEFYVDICVSKMLTRHWNIFWGSGEVCSIPSVNDLSPIPSWFLAVCSSAGGLARSFFPSSSITSNTLPRYRFGFPGCVSGMEEPTFRFYPQGSWVQRRVGSGMYCTLSWLLGLELAAPWLIWQKTQWRPLANSDLCAEHIQAQKVQFLGGFPSAVCWGRGPWKGKLTSRGVGPRFPLAQVPVR